MNGSDTNEEWKEAWSVFEDLVDFPLPTALDKLKKNQALPDLIKQRVEQLLKNSEQHNTTFDGLADAFMLQGAPDIVDMSGQDVGPYHLLKLVGRGGMSSVYEALRNESDIQKKVAIKIMHPYSVSATSMRLFNREQKALAHLDHPNIISFHHGGYTSDGTPFLVTDYIDDAQMINEYVKSKRLSAKEVILLFLKILDAIQYAHANLVIHRDLKPSNLLIDTNGHLKVVDFGIATLDSDRKEHTTMVFTPEYAAPEQLTGQTITTQADVFSLGAVLLSLLSGARPLPEFKQRMVDSVNDEKYIRTVLKNMSLDSDLKNILLQAMQHDLKLRYLTVVDLRQDISNWLDNKPIFATKDTMTYRLKKFIVRNKAISLLLLATFSSLLLGMVATVYQKNLAQHEAHKANEVKSFLLEALASNDPDISAGKTLSVRDLLLEAQVKLSQQPLENIELQAELLQTIGVSFGKIGEHELAIEQLEQAKKIINDPVNVEIDIIGFLFDTKQYDAALTRLDEMLIGIKPQVINSYPVINLRVKAKNHLGEFGPAEEIILNKLTEQDVGGISGDLKIKLNLLLASTYLDSSQLDEAEKLLIQTLELSSELNGEVNTQTIDIMLDLARFYENRSENGIEKSLEYLQQATHLQNQLYQSAHPKLITTLILLANNHKALGQDELALEQAQKSKSMALQLYGEKNIFGARADVALSHLALKTGDLFKAITLLQDAVTVYEAHYGTDHFETNQYKTNLASYLLKADDAGRALKLLNELYEHQVEQLGPFHMATLYVQLNQIKAFTVLEEYNKAISIGEEIYPICLDKLGEDNIVTVGVKLALGDVYFQNHDFNVALPHLTEVEQSIMIQSNPAHHQASLKKLIVAHINMKNPLDAKRYYDTMIASYFNTQELLKSEEGVEMVELEKQIEQLIVAQ